MGTPESLSLSPLSCQGLTSGLLSFTCGTSLPLPLPLPLAALIEDIYRSVGVDPHAAGVLGGGGAGGGDDGIGEDIVDEVAAPANTGAASARFR
jgi:hypothetical protein